MAQRRRHSHPRRPPKAPTPAEERREPRRTTAQEVVVRGLSDAGERFDQSAKAQDFSLRGMSLLLPMPLPLDRAVLAENPATGMRTLYRVVHVEQLGEGVYRIGFEAPDPHPYFWLPPTKE
ncbi:MAG: PilZ domain-containing protein [Acidobacteria bacterium]|nr:PilZ domain-containing protein [Acidobacteriota bacterium]